MKRLLNTLYVTGKNRYLSLDGENVVSDRILIQDAGKSLILGTPEAVRSGCATMNEAFIRVVTQARHAEADRRKETS